MTLLDSTSKEALRKTVRGLREKLIAELRAAADGAYQLSIKPEQAKLEEAERVRRQRLESWLLEQSRADQRPREAHLLDAVKEAAHTLLNRLVVLRILEHHRLSDPAVVTGGLKSAGYREYAEFARALVTSDDTRGYAFLLELVFDELSIDLPGMFGPVGLSQLFPVPAATLREAVEALDDPALDAAWGDDTTLGWVYQFWNDPERERLDAKINDGKKIAPHEIASKTQMFTERYMVEWLLHNSLGQTWLALCKKHGWTPDFEAVRAPLEARRAAWREQREAGEVPPDALMPIESELEERWKYWVPQPLPPSAVQAAPESLAELKLLDPACGSGHFLVIAFDLLAALYREEAKHTSTEVTEAAIASSILEQNLHGIDIDPRAVQIAAAALWLKAKLLAPGVNVGRMNLVAPCFRLAKLPDGDPARQRLEQELEREVGIPKQLTAQLVDCLAGVDHLGTLLRVDRTVEQALSAYDERTRSVPPQGDLFEMRREQPLKLPVREAKLSVLDKIGTFLAAHEAEQDLGLRLEGEQLAAGVRFVRLAQEDRYDLVVGNPPYQGTSKMADAGWFKKQYPRAKADLYACFLERGLELAKPGGVSALLTMRGWMFLSQYTEIREGLLKDHDLAVLADLGPGAFEDINGVVVSVSLTSFWKRSAAHRRGVAVRPTPPADRASTGMTKRKRTGLLAQVGRFEFDVEKLSGIEGTPLVYWWDEQFLDEYIKAPKLGEVAPTRKGIDTGNNARLVRRPWEVCQIGLSGDCWSLSGSDHPWVPYVMGGKGAAWVEPLSNAVRWLRRGLEIRTAAEISTGSTLRNTHCFFKRGVAFTPIGAEFIARCHRYPSICDNMGSSVFPPDPGETCCVLNSKVSSLVLASLNPSIHFQVGDVNRLLMGRVTNAGEIASLLDTAFTQHESHREPSVEFKSPGPSPWRHAQDWAQRAVDRDPGEPLPPYEPEFDAPEPTAYVSFALGVALGRFGKHGEGILDEAPKDALPAGILFITDSSTLADSLDHPAAAGIKAAWAEHAPAITNAKHATSHRALRDYLLKDFFDTHKRLYENRPIYFPLSSEKKSFVAYVSIHRWAGNTLQTLLADHLHRAREALSGQINDLNTSRASTDKKTQREAEKQYGTTKKLLDELDAFIVAVTQCAEKGAPPVDGKCPKRERDATFAMDLDDGVMINSAALWPLLTPQWKDPKKWWKELCTSNGRKDYDWAQLAARYFPRRVDAKCRKDPSLGVAHHCFWKYHPEKAYAWELRLQDEISPNFTIDEAPKADPLGTSEGSDHYRAAFLAAHPTQAKEIEAKEAQRRERNRKKKNDATESGKQTQVTDAERPDEPQFRLAN